MEHLGGFVLAPRDIARKYPAKTWERYIETLTWTSEIVRERYGKGTHCSPYLLLMQTQRNKFGGQHMVVFFDLGEAVRIIEEAPIDARVDLIRTLKDRVLDKVLLSVRDVLIHPFTFRAAPDYATDPEVREIVRRLNASDHLERGLYEDVIIQEDVIGKRLMIYMTKYRDIVAVEVIRGDCEWMG